MQGGILQDDLRSSSEIESCLLNDGIGRLLIARNIDRFFVSS
jgi:hypothetical protein